MRKNEMGAKKITVKVFRFDPTVDSEAYYQDYEVPLTDGMSAINALDYIYQNLDSSIAYYDHAGCALGICSRCTGKVNGKAGLFCQVIVEGDVCLEPASEAKVIKDLVTWRGKKGDG